MRRRNFLALGSAGVAVAGTKQRPSLETDSACGCAIAAAGRRGPQTGPAGLQAFADLQSGIKITGLKVFGVSLTPNSDRPYVFVKVETNQGLIGWGEGTLEGKAGAVMACVNDFKDFLIGADPMQVEHIWQSMYVHSFYRAGPVMGSAISGIDQALWDIRGKALGMPVYKLLGGPFDAARRARLLSRGRGEPRPVGADPPDRARTGNHMRQVRDPRLLRMDRAPARKSIGPSKRSSYTGKRLGRISTLRSISMPRPAPAWHPSS